MKACPKCGSQFGDDMNFCLNDGLRLVDAEAPGGNGEKTVDLSAESRPATQPTAPSESVERPTSTTLDPSSASPPTQPVILSDTIEQRDSTRFQPPSSSPPVFTPPGVKREGSSRSRYLLPLVLTGLAFITFGAGAIGLVAYFYSTRNDVAMANVSEVNRSVNPQTANSSANSVNLSAPFPESNSSQTNTVSASNTEPRSTPTPRNQAPTPAPTRTVDQQTTATPPPVPTPEKRIPKTVAGGVLNGKAISLPKPAYPPAARAVRAGGPVSVQVLIDENGQVISANAVGGHPLLRAAAESAARNARFSPTLLSGQPVKVSGVIVYNFVP